MHASGKESPDLKDSETLTPKQKSPRIFLLSPINQGIIFVFKWLSITCCAVMFVVISLQVILRYGFNTGLPWAEELGRMAMIALAFFSVPAAYYNAQNVRIDVLPNILKGRPAVLLNIIIHIAVGILAWHFFGYAYEFTINGKNTFSASIHFMTMNYIYAVMPISFAALFLTIIERFCVDMMRLVLGPDKIA